MGHPVHQTSQSRTTHILKHSLFSFDLLKDLHGKWRPKLHVLLVIQPHRANRHGNPVCWWVLIKWQETTDLTRLFQKAYASRDCGGHFREGTGGLSVRAVPEPGKPAAQIKEGSGDSARCGRTGRGHLPAVTSADPTPRPCLSLQGARDGRTVTPQCDTGTRRRLRANAGLRG